MNKVIKFRAWDENSDSMFYQDKDQNYCVFSIDEKGVCCWIFPGPPNYGQDPADLESTPCYEIMQFIGRKDKNDKEIYENDIIDICSFNDKKNIYRCVIKDIRHLPEELYGSSFSWCEIVGNTYENPELLK